MKKPPKGKCPLCRKPSVYNFRPFCSKICKDIDLDRWLSGHYVIPTNEKDKEEESPAEED